MAIPASTFGQPESESEALGILRRLEPTLTRIEDEQKIIREELQGIRQEQGGIRQEQQGIRQEQQAIRQEQFKIFLEMSEIKGQLKYMPTIWSLAGLVCGIFALAFVAVRLPI